MTIRTRLSSGRANPISVLPTKGFGWFWWIANSMGKPDGPTAVTSVEALAVAGALASRYLGLLFWGSAVAIELTALAAGLSRSVRRL